MSGAKSVSCDVLVAGSGAGGLAAATVAGLHGLDVIVAEKDRYVGGTTALSGGFMWVPCNPVSQRDGVKDSPEAARTYLQHEAGNHFNAECVDAFLAHGPEAVAFFEEKTALKFEAASAFSDYHPTAPGRLARRPLHPCPALQRPRSWRGDEAAAAAVAGADLRGPDDRLRARIEAFLQCHPFAALGDIRRGPHGFAYARSGDQRTRHAARQRQCARRTAVPRRARCRAQRSGRTRLSIRLIAEGGAVRGAVVQTRDGELSVEPSEAWCSRPAAFRKTRSDAERCSRMIRTARAIFRPRRSATPATDCAWAKRSGRGSSSVIRMPRLGCRCRACRARDGSWGVFPHFIDRAKPGLIAVLPNGKRFVNEANSYHDFVQALFAAIPPDDSLARAFLVVDHAFIRRFGLGFVKPFPVPLAPAIRSGYLKRGRTLAELAAAAGIDAASLEATVAAYNAGRENRHGHRLRQGLDRLQSLQWRSLFPAESLPRADRKRAFLRGRGRGRRSRHLRRPARERQRPGARPRWQPIRGLYAVGNDMASIMGGNYPGGGITLGPAITFGYIAARHMAGADRAGTDLSKAA